MGTLSHMGYVWLSYGATLLVVAVLFAWIFVTGRRRKSQLEKLTTRSEDRTPDEQ